MVQGTSGIRARCLWWWLPDVIEESFVASARKSYGNLLTDVIIHRHISTFAKEKTNIDIR